MARRSGSPFVLEAFINKSHVSAAAMAPQLRTYEEDDKDARGSGKSPLYHQSSAASSKDRSLFPKGVTNANLRSHEASCRSSSPSMIPRRKPWPSSCKARRSEAPAKCSSIGLQQDHMERSAFRAGVIDWGLLERWKYHQKLCQFNGGEIAQKRRNSFESYFGEESELPAKQSGCKLESLLQQQGEDEGRVSTETGRNWKPTMPMMMRRIRFKEGSSRTSTVDGNKENKGRRSPLRRMLDPFLKSKDDVQQPLATNYVEFADMSFCPVEETIGNYQSNDSSQAILQFARRNGVLVFIFSSSDGDVLGATATKPSDTDKEDSECVYTMFRIHDQFKKKKKRQHQRATDVVGRMNVSRSRNHDLAREFVLLGAAQPATELVAIVVKIPEETPSPAPEERSNSDARSIVVSILPGGIHGSTSEAKPSPLLQRWRSGGACDCGGWDEGCRLTVLTAEIRNDSHNSESIPDYDRIELLLRGGSRTNAHVFRMVSPEEGRRSRVEFGTSISCVQAFAMSLAIVDGGVVSTSLEHKGSPKRHVSSYYPPHSPVSRA